MVPTSRLAAGQSDAAVLSGPPSAGADSRAEPSTTTSVAVGDTVKLHGVPVVLCQRQLVDHHRVGPLPTEAAYCSS